MSETEQILDRYTEQQGWSRSTQLDLALAYIENQSSPEDWDDYLRDLAAVDNEMDDDVDDTCPKCKGEGTIPDHVPTIVEDPANITFRECDLCGGTGRTSRDNAR